MSTEDKEGFTRNLPEGESAGPGAPETIEPVQGRPGAGGSGPEGPDGPATWEEGRRTDWSERTSEQASHADPRGLLGTASWAVLSGVSRLARPFLQRRPKPGPPAEPRTPPLTEVPGRTEARERGGPETWRTHDTMMIYEALYGDVKLHHAAREEAERGGGSALEGFVSQVRENPDARGDFQPHAVKAVGGVDVRMGNVDWEQLGRALMGGGPPAPHHHL